jgi:hypothetical protein
MTNNLCSSWLNGKYPAINAEINTRLQYVAIGEYFWQGEEADNVIEEINCIYNAGDLTVEQAINQWASNML